MNDQTDVVDMRVERFVELLVQQTQAGSMTAASELLIRFRPLIQAAAKRYRITGTIDVDDLQQDAAIAFLEATLAFNPAIGVSYAYFVKQRVYAKMWTLVRREQTWKARAQDNRLSVDEPMQQMVDMIADPAADRMLASALAALDLQIPFRALSERERLAIGAILRDIPMQELAKQQGVSIETAKTWRKRALAKLRKAIGEE